ncbi:MAG TPA: hypothetical protein VHD60_02155 [Candidatus Saccharimonadales bacterium]|nr:hypothetical protein [Candidatus Saccharimonadales bacterium]
MTLSKSSPFARIAVVVAACALLFGLTATRSASAESAQQFFGYSGGGTSLPASCDISHLLAKNQTLEKQLSQVNDTEQAQLKEIQTEQSNLKPGDTASGDALNAEQQQILDKAASDRAAIKAQQDAIHAATQGPSEQCKRDTIAQAIAEMQGTESFINSSAAATLAKVDAEVAKIEKLESKLQSSGVNSKDMATIKKDVAAVKAASGTLHGFFTAMSSKAAAFVSQASADPIGTYNAMQGGGGPLGGVSGGTEGAAQSLVDSFTSLINLFDTLSGSTGGK